jgi:sulfoacetaldehyde reductase
MPIALISGASSGFGLATAKLLSQSGYDLILIARREDILKELADQLTTQVYYKSVDVRDREQVSDLFNKLPDSFRKIDVLVNNAGGALGLDTIDTANIDDWEIMIDANIKGLLYLTRQVIPMMKVNNSGSIINIGSIAGHAPYKGGNVYGASKAFVSQFTRNLRTDLHGTNIKATCIEPGMAETEFSLNRFKGDKQKADAVYHGMRPLKAADIAETILWILQRPAHVNIDNIEIMPVDQTWGGLTVNRK